MFPKKKWECGKNCLGKTNLTKIRTQKGTLGGNLLQFVLAYLLWIAASRLHLSAVLCVIAFAMTLARTIDDTEFDARMRVQSYAVWSSVVFTLNVFAFLLMGMQARLIVGHMEPPRLGSALEFAGLITAAVILVRMIVVVTFNRLSSWWETSHGRAAPASLKQALFVGWSGMRGFITIAAAFALPNSFPQRDTVVLTAFCVVLATLVLQGITLAPLAKMLKLDRSAEASCELANARAAMAERALSTIQNRTGPEADNLRYRLELKRQTCAGMKDPESFERLRNFGLEVVRAERLELEKLREEDQVSPEIYLGLQEQLDWNELTLLEDDDRKIEEI